MFQVHSALHPSAGPRLCDGLSRRGFLQVGTIAGLGLTLPGLLQGVARPAEGKGSFGRAKRCVLLFLTGGPPQLDTWDLKPQAPVEIRGELSPISTCVPGIQISELFPRLAAQADKYCIVRSVTHADTVHTSAGYTMLTGAYHPSPNEATAENIRPSPTDHPHLGSIVGAVRNSPRGLPPFVALPEIIRDAGVNTFPGQDAGFLGKQHGPFLVEADNDRIALELPDVFLRGDMRQQRFDERRRLWTELTNRFQADAGQASGLMDRYYEQAFAMIRSPAARQAFDLDLEPAAAREAYGSHLFGKGCLLARRLLEAGVSLVTVYWHYEGPEDSPVWDTHQNNFPHLRNRLMPPTDQALSALLEDLSQRGMLDDTLLICMGEFGRSPKINAAGGRNHWPQAQSIVLAGAGMPAGSVYGSTDRSGGYPADSPVTPPDLAATILYLLGMPPDLMLQDQQGRPIPANQGTPITGLFA